MAEGDGVACNAADRGQVVVITFWFHRQYTDAHRIVHAILAQAGLPAMKPCGQAEATKKLMINPTPTNHTSERNAAQSAR